MGYKREDIRDLTPLSIKKLNDNIRNLWLKVFGNLDFIDLSEALKGIINNKVGNETFNTVIKQTQDEIALNATKDEMNAALTVQAGEIALKANSSDVSSQFSVQAEQIASKVSNDSFDSYVTQTANEISSKVSQTAYENGIASAKDYTDTQLAPVAARVTNAETSITQNANEIALKASKTSVDDLTGRVTTAESSISTQAGQIALKASQSSVDSLSGRVSNAESSISVQAGQISSKVSKDGVISAINQSAETVTISASKISLTGVVTASDLATAGSTTINGSNITTGSISAGLLIGNASGLDSLAVKNSISCTNISAVYPPWAAATHYHDYASSGHTHTYFGSSLSFGSVNGAMTCTYLGSTGNIAANGSLTVTGAKNCVQNTESYGRRLINAYETAEYYFGDIGRGQIINGECIVTLDPIFMQCVNTDIQYEVFLTKYGQGDIWVDSMNRDSFTVKGNNISFGWEVKAKRRGYEIDRLNLFEEGV